MEKLKLRSVAVLLWWNACLWGLWDIRVQWFNFPAPPWQACGARWLHAEPIARAPQKCGASLWIWIGIQHQSHHLLLGWARAGDSCSFHLRPHLRHTVCLGWGWGWSEVQAFIRLRGRSPRPAKQQPQPRPSLAGGLPRRGLRCVQP